MRFCAYIACAELKRKIYNEYRLLGGVGDFLSKKLSRQLHILVTDDMHKYVKNNLRGEIGHHVRQMLLIKMGEASPVARELFEQFLNAT